MQYDDTWMFLKNGKPTVLRYSVVVKNGKVIRVFNYFKVITDKEKKTGYVTHYSISENSEIFQYFSNKYNGKSEEEINSMLSTPGIDHF